MHKARSQLQCITYLETRAAEQLDERQRDSIEDEHRPYNAADGPSQIPQRINLVIRKLTQDGPAVNPKCNFIRARYYAALCKRLKRPVPPCNSLNSAGLPKKQMRL